jgi:hypothetical protein
MIVLFPGSLEVDGSIEDEEEAAADLPPLDAAESVDGICLTDLRLADSPSSLTLAGGAAMCLGSNLERLPLGLAEEAEGLFLLS